MGFKDFFSKGPSGRNNDRHYNQGLPNSAYLAANSATNQRYANNISSKGLQSTSSIHGGISNQRSMSLSSRSLRPNSELYQQQPRTMSVRSNSLAQQRYSSSNQRSMSMTNSLRQQQQQPSYPHSRNISRSNSLTAPRIPNNAAISRTGSRLNSRQNSRANSLTSNSSHTKIIKTTKETDQHGRTRSITTTTIEQRGDVKIVRKTVIQPAVVDAPIDEDAELEALAELENFDHDNTIGEFSEEYNNFDEQDVDYNDQNSFNDEDYYDNPYKNGAAFAAAAALAKSQPQVQQSQSRQRNSYMQEEPQRRPVSSQNPKSLTLLGKKQIRKQEPQSESKKQIRFREPDNASQDHGLMRSFESPQARSIPTTPTQNDSNYTAREYNDCGEINSQQRNSQYFHPGDEEVETIFVDDNTPVDSFKSKAQKRLSEIAEITELQDSYLEDPAIENDYIEQLGFDSLGISKEKISDEEAQTKAAEVVSSRNKSKTSIASTLSEDEFVDTLENFDEADRPAETTAGAQSEPFITQQTPPSSTHRYRDLLYNDSKRSPLRNSIPKFVSKQGDYKPPAMMSNLNSTKNQNVQVSEDAKQYSASIVSLEKPKPLKSALKNNSSSPTKSAISDIDENTDFSHQQESLKKNEISPEEMYALAFKAAEKKVYGHRVSGIYQGGSAAESIKTDASTNSRAQSPELVQSNNSKRQSYLSSPSVVPYKSNAAGMGFRMHSLREPKGNKEVAQTADGEKNISKMKKHMKKEQKNMQKQWEEERKLASSSLLSYMNKTGQQPENEHNKGSLGSGENEANTQHEIQQMHQRSPSIISRSTNDYTANLETPKKSKLRLFRLGKKKPATPDSTNKTHQKNDSIVSQETQNTFNSRTKKSTNLIGSNTSVNGSVRKNDFAFNPSEMTPLTNDAKPNALNESSAAVSSESSTSDNVQAQSSLFTKPDTPLNNVRSEITTIHEQDTEATFSNATPSSPAQPTIKISDLNENNSRVHNIPVYSKEDVKQPSNKEKKKPSRFMKFFNL